MRRGFMDNEKTVQAVTLTLGPLIKDGLCDIAGRIGRTKQKLFRFAADQYEAQVNLFS